MVIIMSEQDHLYSFVASIRTRAEQESGAILTEAEQIRSAELEAERLLLAKEREKIMNTARDEAQKDAGRLLSEAVRTSAAAISEKQLAIRDSVIARAESRIAEFSEGEEYPAFLQASAERLCKALPAGAMRVFLRTRDLAYVEMLTPLFPEGTVFVEDASIRLGGLRAASPDGRVTADDTLDTHLAEQKRRFAETAGLDIS